MRRSVAMEQRKAAEEAAEQTPALFVSAQPSPMFRAIVETSFKTDILKEYPRLESELTIGEHRGDYGTVVRHLDNAESNARLAHKMFLAGKTEREAWEANTEPVRAKMWAEARRALEDEKSTKVAGERRKQITDADVRAEVAIIYPEDFAWYERTRAKYKRTEETLEDLAVTWKSRCRSLQTILSTMRRT